MAARAGLDALIIDMEGKSGLGNIFGHHVALSYHEVVLAEADSHGGGEVRARTLTPDDALLEYLSDHGMTRISKRLASSGALDVVATAAPGIKDILVLGKVKQLERASANRLPGAADLLVLDAPAAGHAFTFLASAQGLMDAVSVGPIRAQAADVLEMLSDPARCQVMLVTLPEETPVNEVVETAFKLEDQVGVHLTPIVVNGLYPDLDLGADPKAAAAEAGVALTEEELARLAQAAAFRTNRHHLQAEQTQRLADALPLAQLRLPFLFTTELGLAEVDALATALAAALATLPEPGVMAASSPVDTDQAAAPPGTGEAPGTGGGGGPGGAAGNGKAAVERAAGPGSGSGSA